MKQRIVIRLHLAVRAVLQSEADWRGTRLGTLTSELIHEQAAKAFDLFKILKCLPCRAVLLCQPRKHRVVQQHSGNNISVGDRLPAVDHTHTIVGQCQLFQGLHVPFCMQSSLKILQNINLCEVTTKRIEDENRKKGEICWNFTQVYRAKHEEKRDAAFAK